MNTQKVPAVVLIYYKGEKENFEEVSPKKAGYGWWWRLFNKGPVSVKASTEFTNLGVRIFTNLNAVPVIFEKILVPVVIDGTEQNFRLVVLQASARGGITAPVVVRCAFDFGYTSFEMKVCSKMNSCGSVDEVVCKWLMANTKKIAEVFKLVRAGRMQGLTVWCKSKTVPA